MSVGSVYSPNGFDVTFHFCAGCGSTVFWEPQRKPEMIAVAVGAFADQAFPPSSLYTSAKKASRLLQLFALFLGTARRVRGLA